MSHITDEMRDFLAANGGRVFKDVEDDNRVDIGILLAVLQGVFFILYGVFVEYGESASGAEPEASVMEMMKYPQFQDVHVMIFLGFGMLMLFLKKVSIILVGEGVPVFSSLRLNLTLVVSPYQSGSSTPTLSSRTILCWRSL